MLRIALHDIGFMLHFNSDYPDHYFCVIISYYVMTESNDNIHVVIVIVNSSVCDNFCTYMKVY